MPAMSNLDWLDPDYLEAVWREEEARRREQDLHDMWLATQTPPQPAPRRDWMLDRWSRTRKLVNLRSQRCCEICESRHGFQVHHLRYDIEANGPAGDLIGVCRNCHRQLHRDFTFSDPVGHALYHGYPVPTLKSLKRIFKHPAPRGWLP